MIVVTTHGQHSLLFQEWVQHLLCYIQIYPEELTLLSETINLFIVRITEA